MALRRFVSIFFVSFLCLFTSQALAGSNTDAYTIIGPQELRALVDSQDDTFLIIDARSPAEYQEVHIPGAVNVPQKKFARYQHLLPENKDKRLIFYCNGVKCGKSKKAAVLAAKQGYTNIRVFAQGMPVWEELAYPVVAGPEYDKKIETTRIAPQDLKAMLDAGQDDFTLVDVRDPAEYAEGHIPGAVNIPVAAFAARSGALDKKKKIIVYCNAGSRSYLAYRKLKKLSYKKIYQALLADWKEAGLPMAIGMAP